MASTITDAGLIYVSATSVFDLIFALLVAHKVPLDDARIVAGCLVSADLRGVDTHGLLRMPGYLDRVRRGLINTQPKIEIKSVTPVVVSVDADNGFGHVAATRAMAAAIAMARDFGMGVAGVRRSTHFGMAANYVLQAVDAGFVGMVFSNAAACMPPWGGRKPLLGTSPLAVGAPAGRLGSFVFDMAAAVAARGKIRKALVRGEAIPEGYALDSEGRPTTDPLKALQGVILPVGGPKGSGISMMMDIFAGVLTGAGCAGDVGDQTKDLHRPQDVGHFLLALKPDLFIRIDEYQSRIDTLIERVHMCPTAEGFTEVLVPGEMEARQEALRHQTGIPYSLREIAQLQVEAANANVPPLIVSEKPLNV
jgi:LDH2 family malate/lactate/ureidoglycolate dehydrogenase